MSIPNSEQLAELDLKILTIQRTVAGRWWNYRNVISPFSRLWLILDGDGVVRHHGKEFKLQPGQLHVVPPFTAHDCFCSRRIDHFHLHFISRLPTGIDLFSLLDFEYQTKAPDAAADFFQRLETLYPNHKLPCFDPKLEEYRRFPARAERALERIAPVDMFEANNLLGLLLTPFLRSAREHQGIHARATRLFLSVQEYIHANMEKTIILSDLSRAAKLHPTYFSDRFKQLVGVRPLEYLMLRRIERSQYLLLTTRTSVKEIAVKVGIADPAYFSRVFTKLCRVSPTAYRADHLF